MSIRFNVRCELIYDVDGRSDFLFNVQPMQSPQQQVLGEDLRLSGVREYLELHDPYSGNRYIRASATGGSMTLFYSGSFEVSHFSSLPQHLREGEMARLPPNVMPYLLPSRHCQSDRFTGLAQRHFGLMPRGYACVDAVCDWVSSHLLFADAESSNVSTVDEVMACGRGTSRDFAHLTISLLRALNIPARFVRGYRVDSDVVRAHEDFHAYVEVFLADRWWIVDTTGLCPRNGLIRVCAGQDAADTPFASVFGPAAMASMKLHVRPLADTVAEYRKLALSTAGPADAPADFHYGKQSESRRPFAA